jgi:hypothetical protein
MNYTDDKDKDKKKVKKGKAFKDLMSADKRIVQGVSTASIANCEAGSKGQKNCGPQKSNFSKSKYNIDEIKPVKTDPWVREKITEEEEEVEPMHRYTTVHSDGNETVENAGSGYDDLVKNINSKGEKGELPKKRKDYDESLKYSKKFKEEHSYKRRTGNHTTSLEKMNYLKNQDPNGKKYGQGWVRESDYEKKKRLEAKNAKNGGGSSSGRDPVSKSLSPSEKGSSKKNIFKRLMNK